MLSFLFCVKPEPEHTKTCFPVCGGDERGGRGQHGKEQDVRGESNGCWDDGVKGKGPGELRDE